MSICKMAAFLNADPFSPADAIQFRDTLAKLRSAIRMVAFDWAVKILSDESYRSKVFLESDGISQILCAVEIETNSILSSTYIYFHTKAKFVSVITNLDEIANVEAPVTFSAFYNSLTSEKARSHVRNIFIHYALAQLAGARRRMSRNELADALREEGDEDPE